MSWHRSGHLASQFDVRRVRVPRPLEGFLQVPTSGSFRFRGCRPSIVKARRRHRRKPETNLAKISFCRPFIGPRRHRHGKRFLGRYGQQRMLLLLMIAITMMIFWRGPAGSTSVASKLRSVLLASLVTLLACEHRSDSQFCNSGGNCHVDRIAY